MLSEIYKMAAELRLLTGGENGGVGEVGESVQRQITGLCAAAADKLNENAATLPDIVTFFPLNEQEKAAYSLSVPESGITAAPSAAANALKKGDVVTFGNYSWIVLYYDEEKGICLVISEDILFSAPLTQGVYAGWGQTVMRQWLNTTFLLSLGTDVDKIVKVKSELSPEILDSVFLLSPEEADKLLTTEQRAAKESWWLRTAGKSTAIVNPDGRISSGGPADISLGIRPAMVINTSPAVKILSN